MKHSKRNGFTLVELMVVLAIAGILLAIAVPSGIKYWRNAEFRKNESYAATAYLAAESRLTWYRTSGQWEEFKKKIEEQGTPATGVFDDEKLNDRIYAITLDAKEYASSSAADNPVLELLDASAYDKSFLKGAIALEIDVESGEVYSAFYGSKCKGLNYGTQDADKYLTMRDRAYDSRRKRLLGYYSAEDTVNTVELDPVRLRITTISLENSEKLSLNWSGNVDSADVSYEISFYKAGSDGSAPLFSMNVSPYESRKNGWSGTPGSSSNMTAFTLKDSNGKEQGSWKFPLIYSDNKYSLVLDAMMSSEVQAALESKTGDTKLKWNQDVSTSILRLASIAGDLGTDQTIYATVKAVPAKNVTLTRDYRDSELVSSNEANTLYGDGSTATDGKIKIAVFRHLSNIRYYDKNSTAEFRLVSKNMDWASVGTGLYEFQMVPTVVDGKYENRITWRENTKTDKADFPAIAELSKNHTLTGEEDGKNRITNLQLGEETIVDDVTAKSAGKGITDYPQYLGLFGEVYGTVEHITLQDPVLRFGVTKNGNASGRKYSSLKALGILAGRSEGNLNDITVKSTGKSEEPYTVQVELDPGQQMTAAVGGMVGVVANKAGDNASDHKAYNILKTGSITGLTMEGDIQVVLDLPSVNNISEKTIQHGIGGIIGYAYLSENGTAKIENCENHANVSGNLFTGGVVGRVDSDFTYNSNQNLSDAELAKKAVVKNSSSDGLILCTVNASSDNLTGHYFGGIAGYAKKALIDSAKSASGRGKFSFAESKKNLLLGTYVGGIVGYGQDTLLNNCSTEKNGYILGSDYVGGIAGGLGGAISEAIRADSGVAVTTNASYVVGNRYVGGIVGENDGNVILKSCINNGVVAGYDRYIGGIVGYNEKDAEILDCASYLSDYDSSIFNMIVNDWKATGSYAGGIAGYNNGKITFTQKSETITVKSVSSIVVGEDYVGGIAGFNDMSGDIDVHYTLIGGRVYAYGDCAGGAFGLNASEKLLTSELTIQPTSVRGENYVGGCIGANVVALTANRTMDGIRADNILGSITGNAYVGGVVGYQRTYTASQFNLSVGKAVRETFENQKSQLLPGLDKNLVPGKVTASNNQYRLTITTKDNTNLSKAANNIPIRAGVYAGGIVGYCERESLLTIQNCKNTGNMILLSGSDWEKGVSLGAYAKADELKDGKDFPEDARALSLHLAGGIIGVNLENQVIDSCVSTGTMTGYFGIGGIVGLNDGIVTKCQLQENFGSATLDYVGGIAGINNGTVENCGTAKNKTISGRNSLGGIVGWNMPEGTVKTSRSLANLTATGDYAGGIAGRNSGTIETSTDSSDARTIRGTSGKGIGGVVGSNESDGTINVAGNADSNGEIVAVGSGVTVTGSTQVGGIIGINHGTVHAENGKLTSKAGLVRASHGIAGGIAGQADGNITNAVNRSDSVRADEGPAGGITAVNTETIADCVNYGNVTGSDGHVGGIVAENQGTIKNCSVTGTTGAKVTLSSRGTDEIGAICAVNRGTITGSTPTANVRLEGSATIYGGITGRNQGTVQDTTLTYMPEIGGTGGSLTVGGAVGLNEENVTAITSEKLNFTNFSGYQYLGGIVGQNGTKDNAEAVVKDSSYSGSMTESQSAAGNCYGGVAGINYAQLTGDSVTNIQMTIKGVYTATSTSTTEQKEALASHAGGITGKNETTGVVDSCELADNASSSLTADYGMLGGVAGFNKGSIINSGSDKTEAVLEGVEELKNAKALDRINENANNNGLKAATNYVVWGNNAQVENLSYDNKTKVAAGRLQIRMLSNGNLGGVTAYNSTSGSLTRCVSGNWFLNNKSEAIGVGTGGIIGMNESENDLNYLINGAFVGRQIVKADTNRFAGGIIGNQNNSTSSDWKLEYCVNYGMIYCYNTHYSGGIMGQWTGTGGTIENCRNYGSLQTTNNADWSGASGGIVAQLYHAYEDNEYNIIGCGNYGNIFTKNGREYVVVKENGKDVGAEGANDSAGILGNITNYQADNAADSQRYSVQILDCVNAPGTEIYSTSMASGIFGFLSSDNPSADMIKKSTPNVLIRIERCRSYGKVLMGHQFIAGIFGDRYGYEGWEKNTIVRSNYAPLMPKDLYSRDSFPIYSAQSVHSLSDGPKVIEEGNGTDNYYMNGQNNGDKQFSDVKLGHGTAKGSGKKDAYGPTAWLTGMCVNPTAFMYDIDEGKYFIATVNVGTAVDGTKAYIDENNNIIQDGAKIGKVLYYLGTTKYWFQDLVSKSVVNVDDPVFVNARESYRRLEGILEWKDEADPDITGKLVEPKNVKASVADGRITITVTPYTLKEAGVNSSSDDPCDPFKYIVELTDHAGRTYTHTIYSETRTNSFELPASSGLTGEMTVRVKAVSMFDDVADSDWVTADEEILNPTLPDPDVRVRLIKNNGYAYEFSLANLADYQDYTGWQVTVEVQRAQTVTLNAAKPTQTQSVTDTKNTIYQMVAQASVAGTGTTDVKNSAQIAVPVSLPAYTPEIKLSKSGSWDKGAVLDTKVEADGTTLQNLSIEISLDAGSTTMSTPPIYRAELVGDWKKPDGTKVTEAVLADTDILTVSAGVATATFSDLPDYIGEAENLKVRIWYAASGLGPVYTYTVESDTAESISSTNSTGSIAKLLSVEDTENATGGTTRTEKWGYLNSTVWGNDDGFKYYTYQTGNLWTWLDYPELVNADTDDLMEPDADGNYTFEWDKDKNPTARYEVSLTGIDADGREVIIPTDGAYTKDTDHQLRIDGSDWNYRSVKLTVTRVGGYSNGTLQIGRSRTGTYRVKERLERPGQPIVDNLDVNELNYRVSWAPISDETGCASYQAYIQEYDTDGVTLKDPVKLGDPVSVTDKQNGEYSFEADLEAYAGKRVVIYIVAQAEKQSVYLDSPDGVTVELTIPARLTAPKVSWKPSWEYMPTKPVEAAAFRNGGLRISLTAQDAASIPPGGSAYLMKAYIYNTEAEARQATATDPGTDYIAVYPLSYAGSTKVPVQMVMQSATKYYHDMENFSIAYAGKWVVFYARISSGSNSASSAWAMADSPIRLPYVKLETPEVSTDTEERTINVTVSDTPNVPGTVQSWKAEHTILTWSGVEGAELYYLDLAGKVSDSASTSGGTKDLTASIRIREENGSVSVERKIGNGWESINAEDDGSFLLTDYATEISGSYTMADRSDASYRTTLTARVEAEQQDDGTWSYTLVLPDVALRSHDDVSIDHDDLSITRSVSIRADVAANENGTSDAYISSDTSVTEWNN